MYPGLENISIDLKFRGYFTPALWSPQREEADGRAEWETVRGYFLAVRNGQFEQLEGLLQSTISFTNPLTRKASRFLLGDAGTDAQLEAVDAWIEDEVVEINTASELCDSLTVWGRLAAAKTILSNYSRNTIQGRNGRYYAMDHAEGHPGYLTTMLEPKWGPVADPPHGDRLEDFEAYDQRFFTTYNQVLAKLGDEDTIVAFGEPFGVRQLAERFLDHLGDSRYDKMMQPFFRRRFEASTGVDCSDFYDRRNFRALNAAARIEAWLDSPDAQRYELGARYFFGHRIP